jgi:predicted phage terminase large subunit-like protein
VNKQEYANLLHRKQVVKSRRDFYTFLKFMSPPEFNWNWHHAYVCMILQLWIMTDKFPFLMIFMPPQHQKSTMMTEYLPAWAFGQSIDYQALLVMYNSTMAKKYNRKIQRIMDSAKYKEIFPDTRLNEKNIVSTSKGAYVKNSEEFEIVGGRGFLKSVGVQGGIAGNPAKLVFMDDVIKNFAEANSETFRDSVYNWNVDELEARLHNDSKVAFTITRRHDDDLAGRLLLRDGKVSEGGKWKVIVLPALREDLENPSDPRPIGGALFPELHSQARLEDIKLKNPTTFNGLYQQRPVAKGGDIIKGSWFPRKKPIELPFNMDDVTWNGWIDGAWTEKVTNDPTANMYEYYDRVNNIVYIRRSMSYRKTLSNAVDFIDTGCHFHGFSKSNSRFNIEMKSSGRGFYDLLYKKGYNVAEIDNEHVKLGKLTRALMIENPCISGRVVLIDEGTWIEPFIIQCEQFPNGKHDDEVDLLCYIVHKYLLEEINPYIYGAD